MKKTTRVNHPPTVELSADNHAVVAPIYQTVKFEFDSLEETEKFLRENDEKIPTEVKTHEYRVAATPEGVRELAHGRRHQHFVGFGLPCLSVERNVFKCAANRRRANRSTISSRSS